MPTGEIVAKIAAARHDRDPFPVRIDDHEILEGFRRVWQSSVLLVLLRRIIPGDDSTEKFPWLAPGPVMRPYRPTIVPRAAVDNEGPDTGRLYPHTETDERLDRAP